MPRLDRKYRRDGLALRSRLRERLVYLPGAVVLLYGFWLMLTAGAPAT